MSRRAAALVGLNSCERIRPERLRNAIQRLVWVPGSQHRTGGLLDVCDDEGSNPRMALRRLLRLYEGRQYREAAGFLLRLPQYTLRAALPDIPIDLLIETLPHSMALLEALYARLLELGVRDAKVLRLEQLLWKVVGLLAGLQPDDQFQLRAWARLLSALDRAAPSARGALIARRRALERTVEGLGKHGLVPRRSHRGAGTETSSSGAGSPESSATTASLVPLRLALKEELEARADACKLGLHKLESLGKHAGQHKGDQHSLQAASHQRQLSLKCSEVQQRLIDNQSVLSSLERARDGRLDELLAELKARVERDKEALRQWSALRRAGELETSPRHEPKPGAHSLAAGLLRFSRGCALALQLMSGDGTPDINTSEYYYHEEDEEEDEEEEGAEESSSSAGYHTDESCSPTPEPGRPTDPELERLRERYAALYAQAQLHVRRALDGLRALRDASDLKTRILYSVVVLSWRLAGVLQASRRLEALRILNGGGGGPGDSQPVPAELEDGIRRQLAAAGAQSGAREVAQQTVGQLEHTLANFPCIRNNPELRQYALACARLAWACLARATPLVLDVAQGTEFRRELHTRHPSCPGGTRVKAVVWPGLREGCQGPYLQRALVITC